MARIRLDSAQLASSRQRFSGIFVSRDRLEEVCSSEIRPPIGAGDRLNYSVRLIATAMIANILLDDETAEVELPVITIPAVRVRRGHQLRLVIPGPESRRPKPVRRDEKLIALVAEAHHARELVLGNADYSLARIARENGRCRTRLGKLVALSCLAPDIVTGIVEGRQPQRLTVSRLTTKPLPLSWDEQRRELGLG